MIDRIQFRTVHNSHGQEYDIVRLWIGGIPFQSDLVGTAMENQVRRMAEQAGVTLDDYRKPKAQRANT